MALDLSHPGPLPCGTVLDDLIAQVTDGSTPIDRAHQAACRYCQAALEAIQQAWEEFQRLARAAVAVPEGLAQDVMTRIRMTARVGDEGLVLDDARGHTRVRDLVLSRVARAAATEVEEVGWAGVLYAGEDPSAEGRVAVSVGLAVLLGPALPEVAERVRERVVAAIERQTGAEVARVDVAVMDVFADS